MVSEGDSPVSGRQKKEPRRVGLAAIDEVRAKREAKQDRRITGPVALIAGGAILLTIVVAKLVANHEVTQAQEELLARQRAAVVTVGKEWEPLRDRIEKTTLEAAGDYKGDYIDPEARTWDFRSAPGIYLRLRIEDAKDVESIRRAARDSAKDAFTGCLFRQNNPSIAAIARGEEDAGTGWQDQPWNLRLGYMATRMLTDEWVSEVKATEDELSVRVLSQQYDKAQREEIPLAIDIVKRADFFLLVLDEDVPEAKELADGGVITQAALQQVPHPARVHLVNLKTGKEIVRLRRQSEADFRFAGEQAIRDPDTLAAVKRQVQNCSLAQTVWEAIRPDDSSAKK